jgi:siderophore ferric iron reductase
VTLAGETTGFMHGSVGEPLAGWHVQGGDNRDVLLAFYDALAARYPHAGQPFWAVRMWTNLMWQPAYLMVVGVHFAGEVPSLDGLSQQRKATDIDGYRCAESAVVRLPTTLLIDHAGRQLRAFADAVFAEINAITKLKRIPALRLLTDRMLGTMTVLQRKRPDLPADSIRDSCNRWLAAMDLTGHGDLDSLFLPDGRELLLIARKGCCLDYLAAPGVYCASCPKQPDDVRLARQHADALAFATS